MKRFLLPTVVIAAAVLAFFALFPEQRSGTSFREYRLSKNPDVAALQKQMDAQQDSLRVLTSARERVRATEIARRLPRSGARFVTTADAGISSATRDAFETRARAELAELGDSLRYPVHLHLANDSSTSGAFLRVAVLPRIPSEGSAEHAGSEPCAIIVLVGDLKGRDATPGAVGQLIATCGFYAAFGAPGQGMSNWLINTRGVHATAFNAPPAPAPDSRHRLSDSEILQEPTMSACLAGNEAACEAAWGGADWMRRVLARDSLLADVTRGTVRVPPMAAQYPPGRDLSDLRVAMTDTRFAELWRSEKAPLEAYREIEGRSIGQFVRDRLLLDVEPHRPGPLRAELSLALGAALALAGALLAIGFTKRQRS